MSPFFKGRSTARSSTGWRDFRIGVIELPPSLLMTTSPAAMRALMSSPLLIGESLYRTRNPCQGLDSASAIKVYGRLPTCVISDGYSVDLRTAKTSQAAPPEGKAGRFTFRRPTQGGISDSFVRCTENPVHDHSSDLWTHRYR